MRFSWFFLPLLLITAPAHADRNWHIGLMGSGISPTFNDPDGSTKPENDTSFKNLIVTYDQDRDHRFFFHFFDQSYKLKASTTNIGQDISRMGGLLSYQSRFRFTRDWKPWIGAGAGYVQESYAGRHTVTGTGFLQTRYADREANNFALVVNTTTEWDFAGDLTAGVHLQYEHGLNEMARVVSLSLVLSY